MSDIVWNQVTAAAGWLQEHRKVAAVGAAVLASPVLVHCGAKLWEVYQLRQARQKKILERQENIKQWIKLINSDRVS